jgi:HK97 family phage major capsid protein
MPTIDDLYKKMDETGNILKDTQKNVLALEKKYDGITADNIKKTSELAAKNMQEIQDLKQEIDAQRQAEEERIKLLELEKINRDSAGIMSKEEKKEKDNIYKNEMAAYLKYGSACPLSAEVIEDIAERQIQRSLIGQSKESIASLKKDLVGGVNPSTGYWIMPDRVSDITQRVWETSPIRPLAMTRTTESNMVEILLDDNEVDAGWVGEVEPREDTNTPEIGMIKIPIHQIYAKPKASQDSLDDAGFDVEGWLSSKVSSRMGRKENKAFVLGNSSKQPQGFLTLPAWDSAGVYQRDAVEQRETTGSGLMDNASDFIKLQDDLLEDYQANAVWAMNRKTFTDIASIRYDVAEPSTDQRFLLDPNMLKSGTDRVLLGKSVVFMADMPTVAEDALAVVYADFREFYTIVDRFGIRVLRDNLTQKPWVLFYTTKRVGGSVTNFEAGKILKIQNLP